MRVAMGDAPDRDAVLKTLMDGFMAKRAGLAMPRKLVAALAAFYTDTLDCTSMEEVQDYGGEDGFEAAIGEVFEHPPGPTVTAAMAWFKAGFDAPAAPPSDRFARFAMGKAKGGSKKAAAPKVSPMDGETDDDDDAGSVIGGGSKSTLDMEARDSARLRLTGAQITALYRSVYQGQIVTEEEVEGVTYGSDCTFTDWARKLSKVNVEPVTQLLKEKNYGRVKDHFVTLIREYNENAMTQEVTIITSFLTASEEMFVGDDAGLCAYILAYLKLYKGRSFPKEVDLRLVVKTLRNSGVASLRDELKSLKEEVKAVKKIAEEAAKPGGLSTLQSKVNTLEQKIARLKPSDAGTKGPNGDDSPKACSYCQEVGHFYRNCPKRLADEKESAAKKDE